MRKKFQIFKFFLGLNLCEVLLMLNTRGDSHQTLMTVSEVD